MRDEDYQKYLFERAKSSAKDGHSSPLSADAVDVLFEQAWEDRSHCGSFTMRLLINEICRLRAVLHRKRIDPISECAMKDDE